MASSYPFKERVLNEIVEALLDLNHCRPPCGGSGGATMPPHSLSLPPLPAIARGKRSRSTIILKRAKRWHFALMPAIEAADRRPTKKSPPIRVSGPLLKKVAEKTAPLTNVEPSHSQLESYELYEIAPLKLRIKIIPVSNTKMTTFGKEEDTKGKRKIADAGLEGDFICNTKKAKLSAKFEAGMNSYSAHRAPQLLLHFGAGETSSYVQRAPFSPTWRNVTVHNLESLHLIAGIFSCYEPTYYDLIVAVHDFEYLHWILSIFSYYKPTHCDLVLYQWLHRCWPMATEVTNPSMGRILISVV